MKVKLKFKCINCYQLNEGNIEEEIISKTKIKCKFCAFPQVISKAQLIELVKELKDRVEIYDFKKREIQIISKKNMDNRVKVLKMV